MKILEKITTLTVVIATLAGAAWVCTEEPKTTSLVQTVPQGEVEAHAFANPCELQSVECPGE